MSPCSVWIFHSPEGRRETSVTQDGDAEVARTLGHGVADAGRVDVAVHRGPGAGEDAVCGEEGVDLAGALGRDDLHVEADIGRKTLDVAEPVDLLRGGGDAQAAGAVPGDVLAGQFLQLRVERVGVVVDLGHVVVADETRALAGRVPGGARGELALLDQHGVGPALQAQVIGQAGAHDAATDDADTRVALHGLFLLKRLMTAM
jgi:hypothetical protein